MRLVDLRLLPDIERIPLGSEIEKLVSIDQHRKVTRRIAEEDAERSRPSQFLASPYADRRLVLEAQANGDVIITRPDGLRAHVYRHAIEVAIADLKKS